MGQRLVGLAVLLSTACTTDVSAPCGITMTRHFPTGRQNSCLVCLRPSLALLEGSKRSTKGRVDVRCRYRQHLHPVEKTMSPPQRNRSLVNATAREVLPKFGLAFLVDDHETT